MKNSDDQGLIEKKIKFIIGLINHVNLENGVYRSGGYREALRIFKKDIKKYDKDIYEILSMFVGERRELFDIYGISSTGTETLVYCGRPLAFDHYG